MAADDIQVSIGAQIDQLIAGFQQAAANVEAQLTAIQTSVASFSEAMESKLVPAAEHAAESLKHIEEESFSIGEAVDGMHEKITAALEFTGIAVAYEGFEKLGQLIEKLGGRAVQFSTLAATLGTTTDNIQALGVAAEEAGLPVEQMVRAEERFSVILTQARDGSGSAIEKLHELGITNEQLHDSAFDVNAMMETLHGRLNDATTAASTHDAILKELGPRYAALVGVLKEYGFTEDEQKEKLNAVAGLTKEEIEDLKEAHKWWGELETTIANVGSRALLAATNLERAALSAANKALKAGAADTFMPGLSTVLNAVDQQQEVVEKGENNKRGEIKRTAEVQTQATEIVTLAELQAVKASVELYKSGTQDRLTAAKAYAQLAAQYYGSDNVKEVQEANAKVLAEERAVTAERLKNFNEISKAIAKEGQDRQRLIGLQLQQSYSDIADMEKEQKERDTFFKEWESEYTDITNRHAKAMEEMQKLNEKYIKSFQPIVNKLSSSFDTEIKKMLAGTESLGTAMKHIFASMVEGIIGNLVKVGIQMMVNAAIAKATGVSAAKTNIFANAAHAASGAMASASEIPVVGWLLAPLAGAAVYAAALAYGNIPSAAGGWEVPYDTLAMVHKDEKVLPANFSKGLDQLIASGGAGGTTNHNYGGGNFSFLDTGGLRKLLGSPQNRGVLMDTLAMAHRLGARR